MSFSHSEILSASGPGQIVLIGSKLINATPTLIPSVAVAPLLPTLLLIFAAGAVLSVDIECTGDPVPASDGNWCPLDPALVGMTQTPYPIFLTGMVTAVRPNVKSFISGSAAFQVVQPFAQP